MDWRLVATGVALQVAFAAVVLLVPGGRDVFDALGNGFVKILSFVGEGSKFIFGNLMDVNTYGFIFAFQVLPTIIFFAALMGVLYHLGVMQFVVRIMALAITKVMRVSGAETTSVCASVFIGQTEAPLTVRPYIPRMTESELITMMIGGMAHIAGGVLAAYVGMLGGGDPEQQAFYAKHLLAASIMAAPATLVIAKLLIPETGNPLTRGTVKMEVEKTTSNVIDAAAAGAGDGEAIERAAIGEGDLHTDRWEATPAAATTPAALVNRRHLPGEIFSVDDYRRRYAQYKSANTDLLTLLAAAHVNLPARMEAIADAADRDPAVPVLDRIDIDVVQRDRHRQPHPQHARRDRDGLAESRRHRVRIGQAAPVARRLIACHTGA